MLNEELGRAKAGLGKGSELGKALGTGVRWKAGGWCPGAGGQVAAAGHVRSLGLVLWWWEAFILGRELT